MVPIRFWIESIYAIRPNFEPSRTILSQTTVFQLWLLTVEFHVGIRFFKTNIVFWVQHIFKISSRHQYKLNFIAWNCILDHERLSSKWCFFGELQTFSSIRVISMAVGSERGLFDIPLWEHRYIKWWPIACGMMAPESSGRHSSPAEIDIAIYFFIIRRANKSKFYHPHEQKINIKSTHALSKMTKKINSAKINKNTENVGAYIEMTKDKKWAFNVLEMRDL